MTEKRRRRTRVTLVYLMVHPCIYLSCYSIWQQVALGFRFDGPPFYTSYCRRFALVIVFYVCDRMRIMFMINLADFAFIRFRSVAALPYPFSGG
ncbi:hypothetical protein L596_023498 [Steinernema carpocapsae]|uniref:Uncharacterized protein n=1 Tax=Steinernema carpocapsae TaxID=34508 RepID=A0A4U5MDT4_STECR|nr:hypothetical protein L596_023498 [Steinernema carpocapsae]